MNKICIDPPLANTRTHFTPVKGGKKLDRLIVVDQNSPQNEIMNILRDMSFKQNEQDVPFFNEETLNGATVSLTDENKRNGDILIRGRDGSEILRLVPINCIVMTPYTAEPIAFEKCLNNDIGTYRILIDGFDNFGSLGLGEDEWPSTVISLLEQTLSGKLARLPFSLDRLQSATVKTSDENDYHSELLVVDTAGSVLLRLKRFEE